MGASELLNVKQAVTALEVDHSKDGESQVTYIVAVLTVACALSTIVVVLRLFTRLRILNTVGADDFVMAFAQILTLGSAATIFSGKPTSPLWHVTQRDIWTTIKRISGSSPFSSSLETLGR